MKFLVFLCLIANSSIAQDAMTAAEFDAYTQGKTLTFGVQGEPAYGAEQYKPNQRVVWTFLDGDCNNGVWYESKGGICFRYDFDPEPKCWKFYDEPSGLRAVFLNNPSASVLYEAQDSEEDMICPGPRVGV